MNHAHVEIVLCDLRHHFIFFAIDDAHDLRHADTSQFLHQICDILQRLSMLLNFLIEVHDFIDYLRVKLCVSKYLLNLIDYFASLATNSKIFQILRL